FIRINHSFLLITLILLIRTVFIRFRLRLVFLIHLVIRLLLCLFLFRMLIGIIGLFFNHLFFFNFYYFTRIPIAFQLLFLSILSNFHLITHLIVVLFQFHFCNRSGVLTRHNIINFL